MDTMHCIQNAIDYVEDHICEDLSTDNISKQAYMSGFHFQRRFPRRIYTESPADACRNGNKTFKRQNH